MKKKMLFKSHWIGSYRLFIKGKMQWIHTYIQISSLTLQEKQQNTGL